METEKEAIVLAIMKLEDSDGIQGTLKMSERTLGNIFSV